jgi:peroxiredoxin
MYSLSQRNINNLLIVSAVHFVVGYFVYTQKFSISKNIIILEAFTYVVYIPGTILIYLKGTLHTYGVPEIFLSALVSVSLGVLVKYYYAKNRFNALALSIGWVLIIALGVIFILPRSYFQHFNRYVAQKSPSFVFTDVKNKIIYSDDLQNKIVLLDFWDTRCVNCIKQFSEYEKLYHQYKQNPNVKILAVNTAIIDSLEGVQNFKFLKKYSFDFVIDDKATFTKPFNIQAVPQSFLIDKKGMVRLIHSGYSDEEYYAWNMGREIERLLRE